MSIAASEKLVTPERSTFPEYVNVPKDVSKVSVRAPFIFRNSGTERLLMLAPSRCGLCPLPYRVNDSVAEAPA